jgi:type IV secretion system protein VirB10
LNEEDLPEVKNELSKVASNPKQNLIVIISIFVIGIFIIVNFFLTGSKDQTDKKTVSIPLNISKPNFTSTIAQNTIPKLPDLPSITPLPPPAPPPIIPITPTGSLPPPTQLPSSVALPTPSIPSTPAIVTETAAQKAQRLAKKNQASIFSIGGAGGGGGGGPSDIPKDNSEIFNASVIDLNKKSDYLIVTGKIIDAILETAINSDTGTPQVKAIISRDVYSESGNNILIPKGSKILGTYSGGTPINDRILITWSSIVYSSGHIVSINAQMVDKLGRTGHEGRYDPKNNEQFANAVMTGAFSILAAKGIDDLVPPATSQGNQNAASATATQITSGVTNIALKNPNPTDLASAMSTVNQICLFVQNSITDKTSTAFTTIITQCSAITLNANGATGQALITQAVAAANNSANLLISSAQSIQTNTQQAATQAYTNLTNTVSQMLGTQTTPTMTMSQGEKIKIQIMQNYIFPKDLTNKIQIIK